MPRALALAALCATVQAQAATDTCMQYAKCDAELTNVADDLRDSVADRIQAGVVQLLQVAPTVVAELDAMHGDSLVTLDLNSSSTLALVAETMYYKMRELPELYWLYYGEQATGRFVGFRRPLPSELSSVAGLTADSLIRTECTGSGQPMQFMKTSGLDDNGGDPAGVFQTVPYNLTGRAWFQQGLQIVPGSTSSTFTNFEFTPVYNFSEGSLGLTAVRRVDVSGAAVGVLGADYSLLGLDTTLRTFPVPPLFPDQPTGESSPLFIVDFGTYATTEPTLIASNLNVTLVSPDTALAMPTRLVPDVYVREGVHAMLLKQPGFASGDTQVWAKLNYLTTHYTLPSPLTSQWTAASYVGTALGVEYPIGNRNPIRWAIVLVTDPASGYTLDNTSTCAPDMSKLTCRSTLLSASNDLRSRVLSSLTWQVKEYLGTAFVIVNTVDMAYNLGVYNDVWCQHSTCGTINITSATERTKLLQHMQALMNLYPEIFWLYMGQDYGQQYLGLVRANGTDLTWMCSDAASGGCNVSKFVDSANNTVRTDQSHPLDRPWYAKAWTLGYDVLRWTDPYVFGSGDVGISLSKKAFGGDFIHTGGMGVWAADFSLEFMRNFLSSLDVLTEELIYVINLSGMLIASNTNDAVGVHASSAYNSLINQTYTLVIAAANAGTWSDTAVSTTMVEVDGKAYFVDYLRLIDNSSAIENPYDFAFVSVIAEELLYDIYFFQPEAVVVSDDDDALTTAFIVVLVLLGLLCCVLVAALLLLWRGKKEQKDPASNTREDPPVVVGEEVRREAVSHDEVYPRLEEGAPALPHRDASPTQAVTEIRSPAVVQDRHILSPGRPAEARSTSPHSAMSKEEVHSWLTEIADLKSELRSISNRLATQPGGTAPCPLVSQPRPLQQLPLSSALQSYPRLGPGAGSMHGVPPSRQSPLRRLDASMY